MAEAVVSELAKTAIGLFFDIVDVLISLLPSAPFRIMLSQNLKWMIRKRMDSHNFYFLSTGNLRHSQ